MDKIGRCLVKLERDKHGEPEAMVEVEEGERWRWESAVCHVGPETAMEHLKDWWLQDVRPNLKFEFCAEELHTLSPA